MHMADALLSPAVGILMIAVSVVLIVFSAYKMKQEGFDEKKIPMMGVLGAFVFAAQMINFTIPGTGSSGHIGGGILLAALLGPYAAVLVLACVLLIQCLFFADGGLLAIGCNIFNMGICAALIAYPLIFRPIIKKNLNAKTITIASVLAVVIGLQLGAFCVVLETMASGVTELPFGTFVLLMQPIHLAIGIVEGLITAAVLIYVLKARPELIESAASAKPLGDVSLKSVALTLLVAALIIGVIVSLFASGYPDGLEWSIEGVTGSTEIDRAGGIYDTAAGIIDTTAFLPDYAFRSDGEDGSIAGTSTSGFIGSILTLALAIIVGLAVTAFLKHKKTDKNA
ncbi:energy-coupling factor ABC transporter permease [Methanosarcinaceae archaeon]|nr:energy-coupling factor ABC transporter permease [Methanosarcinaceae archaeon]